MQEGEPFQTLLLCDADRTQTCNLLIRSQMLYSIKLRRLSFIAKIRITQINSEEFLIKNILPATVALYILQYQPVASGIPPVVASGVLPGFPVRAVGPDEKTVRRCSATVPKHWKHCKSGSGRAGDRPGALRNIWNPLRTGAFGTFGDSPGGVVRDVWRLFGLGRSGAVRSVGSFTDGSDADRAASGCGYLISRSGCSRRKCSQLCDPLREAAFLPPPSPLTRSGPRTAWSGLEVV